ncbi:hypothetical protein HSR121_1382 [Halapricum desulfuricans]|uniref:HAMP domain-containing protein n=1 Tax=Halapricum desulfuricans TaxID=2841257 RepID=A0A897N5T2_9EURY|nr:hypothetical protein HSR121_1382 [Halapricum desulfuricans]
MVKRTWLFPKIRGYPVVFIPLPVRSITRRALGCAPAAFSRQGSGSGDRPERDLREVVTRRRIYSTADAVSDGNLDVRIDTGDLEGDFRDIATRIDGMIDSFRRT